ncbi:MAG: hypothetical protein P4L51_19650 [Puia sp.]|nr:hypothetical protein [Puia sp.]
MKRINIYAVLLIIVMAGSGFAFPAPWGQPSAPGNTSIEHAAPIHGEYPANCQQVARCRLWPVLRAYQSSTQISIIGQRLKKY